MAICTIRDELEGMMEIIIALNLFIMITLVTFHIHILHLAIVAVNPNCAFIEIDIIYQDNVSIECITVQLKLMIR